MRKEKPHLKWNFTRKCLLLKINPRRKTPWRIHNTRKNNHARIYPSEKAAYPAKQQHQQQQQQQMGKIGTTKSSSIQPIFCPIYLIVYMPARSVADGAVQFLTAVPNKHDKIWFWICYTAGLYEHIILQGIHKVRIWKNWDWSVLSIEAPRTYELVIKLPGYEQTFGCVYIDT